MGTEFLMLSLSNIEPLLKGESYIVVSMHNFFFFKWQRFCYFKKFEKLDQASVLPVSDQRLNPR